jgi:hypothetical protein
MRVSRDNYILTKKFLDYQIGPRQLDKGSANRYWCEKKQIIDCELPGWRVTRLCFTVQLGLDGNDRCRWQSQVEPGVFAAHFKHLRGHSGRRIESVVSMNFPSQDLPPSLVDPCPAQDVDDDLGGFLGVAVCQSQEKSLSLE